MGLRAFHFKYIGDRPAETYKFYQKFIRGFLRWHRTQAVWIKGGIVKKEAYIIVTDALAENMLRMLNESLEQGGKYAVIEVNPYYVIYEAEEFDREIIGYLRQANVTLGNPDEICCPKEGYEEVSVQEYCWGKKFGARCDAWDGTRCIYPKRF